MHLLKLGSLNHSMCGEQNAISTISPDQEAVEGMMMMFQSNENL